jgi:hypothetical protein
MGRYTRIPILDYEVHAQFRAEGCIRAAFTRRWEEVRDGLESTGKVRCEKVTRIGTRL